MNESTETPVERLVRAAREYAAADKAVGRLTKDNSEAEFCELCDKLLEADSALCDAARAVGDE